MVYQICGVFGIERQREVARVLAVDNGVGDLELKARGDHIAGPAAVLGADRADQHVGTVDARDDNGVGPFREPIDVARRRVAAARVFREVGVRVGRIKRFGAVFGQDGDFDVIVEGRVHHRDQLGDEIAKQVGVQNHNADLRIETGGWAAVTWMLSKLLDAEVNQRKVANRVDGQADRRYRARS